MLVHIGNDDVDGGDVLDEHILVHVDLGVEGGDNEVIAEVGVVEHDEEEAGESPEAAKKTALNITQCQIIEKFTISYNNNAR